MRITVDTEGMENLTAMMTSLGESAAEVAKRALYDGAGVTADAFGQATGKIRTEKFSGKKSRRLPSPEEKAALEGKTGIARFNRTAEDVTTLVGVSGKAGYTMLGKRKTAVRLIARSINSGTSFMNRQPVYRQAVSSSRKAATETIVNTAETLCNEIINGKTQQ